MTQAIVVAAGIALSRAGCDVSVLERESGSTAIGAGVSVSARVAARGVQRMVDRTPPGA